LTQSSFGNGIPWAVTWVVHKAIQRILRRDTANACLHVSRVVSSSRDYSDRGPSAYLTKSKDIPHGKVPTDLDHHVVRGTLYPVHGSGSEVRLGQEFRGGGSNGVTIVPKSTSGSCSSHTNFPRLPLSAFKIITRLRQGIPNT